MSRPAEGKGRNVACPSCGAPVRFRGATSIVAVCAFCKSTLVREGVEIENVGRQAELLEDHSPIRIGTEGYHRGEGFSVVGRIQFKYEAGTWNEWYVLFRGSRAAWLSDASREYSIGYLVQPQQLPFLEKLKPGDTVRLAGDKSYAGPYSVTHIDEGEVVAGEGELPFCFTAGWKSTVVDLRGEGAQFATVDYSETPPHLYAGEKLPFDAFRFSGLRDPEQAGGFTRGTALAFKCAGCGAPIEKHLTTTEVVACGSCGTVSDVTGEAAQLVQKNELNAARWKPLLPPGAKGEWRGVRYEVVGYMRRAVTVDGENYEWGEYLLHNVERGYAWITEYNGHFNFVHAAAEVPKKGSSYGAKPSVRYLGRSFQHFQKSKARVSYLTGEFYWRVKLGESVECSDYVAPPLLLSSERTGKELSWSLAEYVEGPEVWKAFTLESKPPRPVGVAANQPSPYKGRIGRYWLAWLAFAFLGLIAQTAFEMSDPSRPVAAMSFETAGGAERSVSEPFEVGGWGTAPLTLRISSNATTDWLALAMQLTNADTGQAFAIRRQLGHQNIGGTMQGHTYDVAEFDGVPSGRYTLAVEARAPRPTAGTIEVKREPHGWSNYWLFLGFLSLWPVLALLRALMFETKRWSESDYADQSTSSDDD